jgi:hypothetical protein
MKLKKRNIIIVLGMLLATTGYDICKAIFKDGVKDGKANAVKTAVVKK